MLLPLVSSEASTDITGIRREIRSVREIRGVGGLPLFLDHWFTRLRRRRTIRVSSSSFGAALLAVWQR